MIIDKALAHEKTEEFKIRPITLNGFCKKQEENKIKNFYMHYMIMKSTAIHFVNYAKVDSLIHLSKQWFWAALHCPTTTITIMMPRDDLQAMRSIVL